MNAGRHVKIGRFEPSLRAEGEAIQKHSGLACPTGTGPPRATLPRAAGACTQEQVDLTQWAVNSGANCNLLLSHFTFICYDQNKPLQDPDAHLYVPLWRNAGELTDTLTHWDIGSFYERRKEMYEMLMGNKIRYSICGHSHRAGAYAFGKDSWLTSGSMVNSEVKTSATLFSDPQQPERLAPVGKNKVLVCGASGPFSYQNLMGELGGYGMDFPQGLILDVTKDAVEWKKHKSRKPRLAVVLDYLWYVDGCKPFFNAGLRRDGQFFDFSVTDEFIKTFQSTNPFQTITLVAVVKEKDDKSQDDQINFYSLTMTVHDQVLRSGPYDPGDWTAGFDTASWTKFKNDVESKEILGHFLSITFKEAAGVTADQYDLETPWCFPVKITGDYDWIYRPEAVLLIGKEGGELPDLKWYKDNGPRPQNLWVTQISPRT